MSGLARAIFAAARLAMPAGKRAWLAAMAAELPHVPPNERVSFSLGAARFALTARMEKEMVNKVGLTSFAVMAGSAFLTFIAMANGWRLFTKDPAVGIAFGAMGALWLAVFLATMARRWDLLARIATGGLAASLAIGVGWAMALPALAANSTLFGALALEALFLFAALLTIVVVVRRSAESL